MATPDKPSSGMDIGQAQAMWRAFNRFLVIGVSAIVVLLLALAIFLI
jgi:Bacterial aa3 type cytochrome c oxidase subunit IV